MASPQHGAQVTVPLWTVLVTMGGIGCGAWAWLFAQIMDLRYELLELHRLLQAAGLGA